MALVRNGIFLVFCFTLLTKRLRTSPVFLFQHFFTLQVFDNVSDIDVLIDMVERVANLTRNTPTLNTADVDFTSLILQSIVNVNVDINLTVDSNATAAVGHSFDNQ